VVAAIMIFGFLGSALLGSAAWIMERVANSNGWARRGIWAGAMMCSLALPGVQATLKPADDSLTSTRSIWESSEDPSVRDPEARHFFAGVATAWNQLARNSSAPRHDGVLTRAWLAATIVVLCVYGCGWLRLHRLRRRWPRRKIGGRLVWITDGLGPAALGFGAARILIPERILTGTEVQLSIAIEHEQQHVSAGDPWLWWFALLLVALAPWNLPLWWQLRRLRLAIEVDCDARVVQAGTDVSTYGQALLDLSGSGMLRDLALVNLIQPGALLERRIRLLMRPSTPFSRNVVGLHISLAIALFLLAAYASFHAPRIRDVHSADLNAFRWRDGVLQLENASLGDVLDELTRYTDLRIVIRDPRIAQIRISGALNTRDVRLVLDRISNLEPSIKVSEQKGQLELSVQREFKLSLQRGIQPQ
jgi:bla regulator protein blaR1